MSSEIVSISREQTTYNGPTKDGKPTPWGASCSTLPNDVDCGSTCTDDLLYWSNETCYCEHLTCCPYRSVCSRIVPSDCPTFDRVTNVGANHPSANYISHVIICNYDVNDFNTVESIQAYLDNATTDADMDEWRTKIMPHFASFPADKPPVWALNKNCARMFSTGPDGEMCRKWRDYIFDSIEKTGNYSYGSQYDTTCENWCLTPGNGGNPECKCIMRDDAEYGDKAYKLAAISNKVGIVNDGCWYGPCTNPESGTTLIKVHEAVPAANECKTVCSEINVIIDDEEVQESGILQEMACPINKKDEFPQPPNPASGLTMGEKIALGAGIIGFILLVGGAIYAGGEVRKRNELKKNTNSLSTSPKTSLVTKSVSVKKATAVTKSVPVKKTPPANVQK